jgi:hypothetical protein
VIYVISSTRSRLAQQPAAMDCLPSEIAIYIVEYCVVNHYYNKNSLLQLRTVSKLFDEVLKPYVLRTLQLEFTRLDKAHRRQRPLAEDALRRVGGLCHALYLDMMLVRDEGTFDHKLMSVNE